MSLMGGGGRSIEEEIFGRVTTTDSTGWKAFLSPSNHLPTGASDSVPVFGDHGSGQDWGWFDVGATDGGCQPNGVASSAESHRLPSGQLTFDSVVGTDTLETHCVATGTSFRLDLITVDLEESTTLQFRRPLDWEAWNAVSVDGHYLYIDDEFGDGATYFDIQADFDQTGGTDTVAPTVQITATQSAKMATWVPLSAAGDGKYHIPVNFVVRVGAWTTTSTADLESVLVRYFWNHGSNYDGTRFVSLAGLPYWGLARTKQYSGTPPFDRTVRAHFVLPHQVPSPVSDTTATDYGKILDLSLRIDSAFTAVISVDDTVVVGDTVDFTDTGANGGGVLSRLWNFGDGPGDTVTATAPSHVYTTSGTKTVVLSKTHTYHGLQVVDTAILVVGDPLVAGSIEGGYDGWPTDNEIEENGECWWRLDPTGGFGSYTYVWQRLKRFWNTIPDETGGELYMEDVGTTDFSLRAIISSGPLVDTTAVLSMTVDPAGQVCNPRK
jgi:hypothetical protein